MIKKVPHKFICRAYSEEEAVKDDKYSAYFFMGYKLSINGTEFGGVLTYGKGDKPFKVLRNLVKRKHETIENYLLSIKEK